VQTLSEAEPSDTAETFGRTSSNGATQSPPIASTGVEPDPPPLSFTEPSSNIVEFSLDQFLAQVKRESKDDLQQENAVVIPAMMARIKAELRVEIKEELIAEIRMELQEGLRSRMNE
jgi:hypothetical protein